MIGAVIGLAIALGVSYAMFRVGLRLNLGRFFAIVGSLFMVVAAGLLADFVQNLQELKRPSGRVGDALEHERDASR